MSGMFQRIARRHADRSDEPADSSTEAQPAPAPAVADAPPAPQPSATDPDQPTVDVPAQEAPTERIDVVAPAPAPDQPAAFQPSGAASPAPPQPGAPLPATDLSARLQADQPASASAPAPAAPPQPPAADAVAAPARRPGFRARGRMRRRLRYLRKLRELQVRDLGGLVFDLRRFERKRDDLIAQKMDQIRACDDELHALELALDERRELRDVREPGIGGTCPRCFAVFGSADRFCANCGAALGGAVQGPAQVPLAPSVGAPPPAVPSASPSPPEAGGPSR